MKRLGPLTKHATIRTPKQHINHRAALLILLVYALFSAGQMPLLLLVYAHFSAGQMPLLFLLFGRINARVATPRRLFGAPFSSLPTLTNTAHFKRPHNEKGGEGKPRPFRLATPE